MSLSNYGSYLDLDEILADEVKFPCKLEVPLHSLGFIDPKNGGNSDEDIKSGTKLELPYWLAKDLCNRNRNIVSVDKPMPFKNVFKEIMRADSTAMDLSKHSLHYYGYGLRCSEFSTIPDNDDVREALMECFIGRFRLLADLSMNSINSDVGAITSTLDVTEKRLFQHGQEANPSVARGGDMGSPAGTLTSQSLPSGRPDAKPLEFKAAMRDFGIMFPTLDSETIETVLRSNNGAVDATIDQLLEMCDSMGLNSDSKQHRMSSTRRGTSQRDPAIDSVDSYNMHLASVTPPKNSEGALTESNLYANLPVHEESERSRTIDKPKSISTSYKYQTALYKFNNPFLGPLPEDFLRVKNDECFDRDMQYARQRARQLDDIKNSRLSSNHYVDEGFTADFAQVVTPSSGEPRPQGAWAATNGTTGTINPATGAVPKNYNKSWSGTAKNTISTFGKKLTTIRGNSSTLASSTGTPTSTNLGRNKGVTPSTMNLLGDCDDEDEANGDADDEMLGSNTRIAGTLEENSDENSSDDDGSYSMRSNHMANSNRSSNVSTWPSLPQNGTPSSRSQTTRPSPNRYAIN